MPDFLTISRRSFAEARSIVIGFSHITLNPASRKAFAMSRCVELGVTMDTKSTRSSSGSAASFSTTSCQVR